MAGIRLSWDDIQTAASSPANRGGTGVTSIASLRSLLNIPDALTGSTLPIGGDIGEILQKTGSGDYAVDWQRSRGMTSTGFSRTKARRYGGYLGGRRSVVSWALRGVGTRTELCARLAYASGPRSLGP